MTTETQISLTTECSEIATFYLDDLLVGIDIRQIQEINRHVQTTAIPHAVSMVRGVINLRGDMVTVLDLPLVLGMEPCVITPKTRVVIIDSDKERTGLLIDKISDVVKVQSDEIAPSPANLNGIGNHYFKGVVRLDTELLAVLDVNEILSFDSE